MEKPVRSQSVSDGYLGTSEYCLSPTCTLADTYVVCVSPDVTMLITRSSHNLFKTLDLPSGEGALTTLVVFFFSSCLRCPLSLQLYQSLQEAGSVL